jgi:hypothetical protein
MKTDTLSLTQPIQQFKLVVKDRLFYNRFEYAIGFHMDEASCLRELDHAEIDCMIKRRIAWREIAQQRVAGTGKSSLVGQPPYSILSRRHKEITEQTVSDLHGLAELLLTSATDFKLVVSVNNAHVYTNDRSLIDQLSDLPGVTQKDYTRAIVGRPKDTIRLKNPKHAFRSYFKRIKLTGEQKTYLSNFLANQTSVRTSPAFGHWLTESFLRTEDYFFVDHNEIAWLTMLSLVRPGLIRKTMQIIPAK